MNRISFGLSGKGAIQNFSLVLVKLNSNVAFVPKTIKYVLPTNYYIIKSENLFISGIASSIRSKLYTFNRISVRQADYILLSSEVYLSGIAVTSSSQIYTFDGISVRQGGYIVS
ncbi:MAG: hypothetical protein QXU79_01615 [Candidatus Micrarchaeaceae archaeon]